LTTHQPIMSADLQAGVNATEHQEGNDLINSEGEGMIEAALALAKTKVVVKRAPGAEWLGGRKPASSITGKATRFDIYPLS